MSGVNDVIAFIELVFGRLEVLKTNLCVKDGFSYKLGILFLLYMLQKLTRSFLG